MGEELPDTCRVSCWSKFGKLVYLVGFVTKNIKELFGFEKLPEISWLLEKTFASQEGV